MMRGSHTCTCLALLALAACANAGDELGLPELPTGAVAVGVVLDRDGTGTTTAFDTTLSNVRVALLAVGGRDTLATATTDSIGIATFLDVPIGRYQFVLVPASLGDSLPVVVTLGDETFRIVADPAGAIGSSTVLVSYPTLTLAEVRAAEPGRRVFVHGLVNSALQYHPDSATYLTDGANYLRVIPSVHRPGRSGNNRGDSVIVLGTTGQVAGQPVLVGGEILTISERPVPIPVTITVADIPGALGGTLDAAVVVVDSAVIADTATVDGVFELRVASATDTALVRIDSTVVVSTALFAPGRSLRFRGVLVPNGEGIWYVRPRPVSGELVILL